MTFSVSHPQIKRWMLYFIIYIILIRSSFYYLCLSDKYLNNLTLLIYLTSIIPLTAIVFMPNRSNFIWIKRILIYYLLMIISLFISNVILCNIETFFNFDINNVNQDNARYTLSSLIQGEAAIVAIVITLTLVAIQQTSSLYSTRLIDIIKYKNPDFWILLVVYIGSMIYELSILISLNDDVILKGHIFFAYVSGLFSLITLFPYMLNTIDLLKPSTMMAFLAEKITKDNILYFMDNDINSFISLYNRDFVYKDTDPKNYKDPVLPLVDLINSSLMKYDYDTSRNCLYIITNHSLDILNNTVEDTDFNQICALLTKHFFNIGKLAIYKGDEECASLVMSCFFSIEEIIIKNHTDRHFSSGTIYVIERVGKLGEIAAEQNNTGLIVTAISYIKYNIDQSFENNMIYLQKIITISIGKIGEKCIEYRVRDISTYILEPLLRIITIAFKEKFNEKLAETVEYKDKYKDFSEEFKEMDIIYYGMPPKFSDDLVMLALNAIIRMGEIAYKENMEDDTLAINRCLYGIGKNAQEIGRKDISEKAFMFVNKH